jgi:Ulp1 family protease
MNMHRNVKSWTKNVDIFSKDFLIIPINERYRSYNILMLVRLETIKLSISVSDSSCLNDTR